VNNYSYLVTAVFGNTPSTVSRGGAWEKQAVESRRRCSPGIVEYY